jgi:alpha-mannosidase
MVYEDAERLYSEVRKEGNALIEEAFHVLFKDSTPVTPDAKAASGNLIAFNTTFFPRRDVVKVPLDGSGYARKLKSMVVQTSKDGKEGYALMNCSDGDSLSFCSGLFADCNPASGEVSGTIWFMVT